MLALRIKCWNITKRTSRSVIRLALQHLCCGNRQTPACAKRSDTKISYAKWAWLSIGGRAVGRICATPPPATISCAVEGRRERRRKHCRVATRRSAGAAVAASARAQDRAVADRVYRERSKGGFLNQETGRAFLSKLKS